MRNIQNNYRNQFHTYIFFGHISNVNNSYVFPISIIFYSKDERNSISLYYLRRESNSSRRLYHLAKVLYEKKTFFMKFIFMDLVAWKPCKKKSRSVCERGYGIKSSEKKVFHKKCLIEFPLKIWCIHVSIFFNYVLVLCV